jgi:hypothetical protein
MRLSTLPLTIAMVLAVSGCSNWWKKSPSSVPASPDAKYEKLDVESLALYGGELVRSSHDQREAECRHAKDLSQAKNAVAIRLHLAAALSLSDSCGSLNEARDILVSSRALITDKAVLAWVDHLDALVESVVTERNARDAIEAKMKQARSTAKRSQRQAKTKESELKTLRNKLDALKSIEQGLGGSQEVR